ncbi:MAG: hypothetical protein HC932_03140 [Thermales bacterium]|nr:hypothetical protein [Thermales bacterium]
MKTELTFFQYKTFCSYLWNYQRSWTKKNFWKKIFETESRRTFDEGWDHCKSSFSFSPKEGWNWEYKTTSGTILRASQRVFGYSHQLPEIAFEVEIPEARAKRGRTHYSYLQIALANLPYMRWIQYQKEDTDTKIRIVNILSGKIQSKGGRSEFCWNFMKKKLSIQNFL